MCDHTVLPDTAHHTHLRATERHLPYAITQLSFLHTRCSQLDNKLQADQAYSFLREPIPKLWSTSCRIE